MERNDNQTTAGVQVVDGGLHALPDCAKLIVDGDADGLEAALGRMLLFPEALAGMAERMISTSSSVVSMGRSVRTRSMAAAICGA